MIRQKLPTKMCTEEGQQNGKGKASSERKEDPFTYFQPKLTSYRLCAEEIVLAIGFIKRLYQVAADQGNCI